MKQATMLVVMMALATVRMRPRTKPRGPKPASPGGRHRAGTAAPGKRPPQAKTQPEFDAYKAAVANTTRGHGEIADDFADQISR